MRIVLPDQWPSELGVVIRDVWREPWEVARLSGVDRQGAYRVTAARGELIIKGDAARNARYEQVAPVLRGAACRRPPFTGPDIGMALEAIPLPLDRSRWVGEPPSPAWRLRAAAGLGPVRKPGRRRRRSSDGLPSKANGGEPSRGARRCSLML